jgi:hypothetical protein
MSSIFLPLIFLPTRLLIPAVAIKGRKIGGRKMKSKSSHQFFWDATWNNIVTYCTPGITNAVAEGINSKTCPSSDEQVVIETADSIPTHSNAGWTLFKCCDVVFHRNTALSQDSQRRMIKRIER